MGLGSRYPTVHTKICKSGDEPHPGHTKSLPVEEAIEEVMEIASRCILGFGL